MCAREPVHAKKLAKIPLFSDMTKLFYKKDDKKCILQPNLSILTYNHTQFRVFFAKKVRVVLRVNYETITTHTQKKKKKKKKIKTKVLQNSNCIFQQKSQLMTFYYFAICSLQKEVFL